MFVPVKPCLVFRDKHHSLLDQSYKTRAPHDRMAPFFTSKFSVIYKMTRGLYHKTYCSRNLNKKVFKSGVSVKKLFSLFRTMGTNTFQPGQIFKGNVRSLPKKGEFCIYKVTLIGTIFEARSSTNLIKTRKNFFCKYFNYL